MSFLQFLGAECAPWEISGKYLSEGWNSKAETGPDSASDANGFFSGQPSSVPSSHQSECGASGTQLNMWSSSADKQVNSLVPLMRIIWSTAWSAQKILSRHKFLQSPLGKLDKNLGKNRILMSKKLTVRHLTISSAGLIILLFFMFEAVRLCRCFQASKAEGHNL